MNTVGIREAKAHLSALVRAAAEGELTLITDHGKPMAVIGPADNRDSAPAEPSEPRRFRRALLAVPYEVNVDF